MGNERTKRKSKREEKVERKRERRETVGARRTLKEEKV